MRRILLAAVVLLLLGSGVTFAARDISKSCDVPLTWGDVQGLTVFQPMVDIRRPARITMDPALVVAFEAGDGTVRLIQAKDCRVLAKITRN